MKPPTIDVELTFTAFVQTFRRGGPLSGFVGAIPSGLLNADYYFPDDNVIAELKTLERDALDPDTFGPRVIATYKRLGYQFDDFVDWLFRRKNFPEDVANRLFATMSRPIVQCVKKASKQIRATRKLLKRDDALGLILIANSGNFGLQPNLMASVIGRAFDGLRNKTGDAIVYLTPNVYHDIGDGIAYEFWAPVGNEGGETLQTFIDDLGKAWFDFREKDGLPAVRKSGPDFEQLLKAKVVRDRDE